MMVAIRAAINGGDEQDWGSFCEKRERHNEKNKKKIKISAEIIVPPLIHPSTERENAIPKRPP